MVQSSALDCGPAALAALLRGLGAPASYEALRDHCSTDVDGTSIDALEAVAVASGVDAEQLVVPVEHIFALPEEYLPAIAVTLLPDGFTHFVVLWARHGRWVEVMDPAVGRRLVRVSSLVSELYRHRLAVPAQAWRDWAGSEVFTTALSRRLHRLGLSTTEVAEAVEGALADPGVESLASVDAATRTAERASRRAAADVFRASRQRRTAADDKNDEWSCVVRGDGDVELRGAVIVRARDFDATRADPEFAAALARVDPPAWRVLAGAVPGPGRRAVSVAVMGVVVGAAVVAQQVVLTPFLQGDADPRALAFSTAVIVAVAVISLGGQWWVRQVGRRVDRSLRRQLAAGVAGLPDSWIRTRPASDLAERGHLLHRLRDLPSEVLELVVAVSMAVTAAVVAVTVAPAAWIAVSGLLLVSVVLPGLGVRAAAERDIRVRTLAGTLAGFVQDALLGAEAVAAAEIGAALKGEHEGVLTLWARAARSLVAHSSGVRLATDVVGAFLVPAAVLTAAGTVSAGATVLVAVLCFGILDGGARLADLLSSAPIMRSTVARISSSIAAAGSPVGIGLVRTQGGAAPDICLTDVEVAAGGCTLLSEVDVTIPSAAHVGVVGSSGAGKSTLLGVVLGVVEPTRGTVTVGGDVLTAPLPVVYVASEVRLWNNTLAANVSYGSSAAAEGHTERLAAAEAEGVARRLSKIGDPPLGDGGRLLSDGEAQRIRLARAFGRPDAPLVVLDEPFLGLERERRTGLMRLARGWWASATLVYATHDVADTLGFDLVIVVDGGRIAETGPPSQLASRSGRYRQLLDAAGVAPFGPEWRSFRLSGSP